MFSVYAYITTENADFYNKAELLGHAKTAELAIKFAESVNLEDYNLPSLPAGQIYDVCVECE